ncbi:NAD(P)-dependent oxidoreductase [Jannaschia sp. CCS1]|uniref:NAD(P)-dependent oxidoreductase n=1 Tax=Jannaschia sp. (strain CCS1) TaxID=290400 RepID=UPI000053C953|nr:NAD(P)-dependent oxidoreductase [Jannaschia sp. CCS1]ABD54511.1 6-phosphogluconate dehydrogenase NAD-binding protein [Jannaschia sp. CCS1]
MQVGFIGLGSVGGKLAGSLLRNGVDLSVHDLDAAAVAEFVARGARAGGSAAALMRDCDVVITCLPSPAASAAVVDQMLPEVAPGKIWMEMSTTDAAEVLRLAPLVEAAGGAVAECPVSGGCHRAATGNIAIYMSGAREVFDRVFSLLAKMGRRVLHTGPLGAASTLKVMTNYLATTHLLALCESLAVMRAAGVDLGVAYEAIAVSSGNSFVHETESQLILSGSRDVNFTLDLIQKDVGLFQATAERNGVPLELSPKVIEMLTEGQRVLGDTAQSDRMIELLETATGLDVRADGFPMELIDDEPEAQGYEVVVQR